MDHRLVPVFLLETMSKDVLVLKKKKFKKKEKMYWFLKHKPFSNKIRAKLGFILHLGSIRL